MGGILFNVNKDYLNEKALSFSLNDNDSSERHIKHGLPLLCF